jgi:zinc protease
MVISSLARSLSLSVLAAAGTLATGPAQAQRTDTQAAAPPAVAKGQITVPAIGYTRRVLANGLTVYATRNTGTSDVHVHMIYDVGAKDDPAGRSGFAHLFEHILSRVTRNLAPGQLNRIVEEEAGGTRGAGTQYDRTRYFETVPANRLEAMLWAHAERLARSVLDQSVFDAERSAVKEETRETVLAQPYGRLMYYYAYEHSFIRHPYQRPVLGTFPDLDAATLEEARAFHENFYRPDNATLIVSGNFDPAQLDRWVDQHLARIPRPARPIVRHRIPVQQASAARTVAAYAPNVPLPAVLLSWERPKGNHADHAALEVLTRVLATGESSRLVRRVVREQALATSIIPANIGLKEAGFFALLAIAAGGKEPVAVEAALDAEVARLRDEPVSDAELRGAITEYVSAELFRRESPMARAEALAEGVVVANDPAWSDKVLAAVQRVTASDIQRVARQYLRDDRRVAITYRDEGQRRGLAETEPWQRRTAEALGQTLPAAVGAPNTAARDGERVAPPAPGPQRPIAAPAFAERRLANGMRVVVARSGDLPVAGVYLVMGGGAAADPADRPGVASMTATVAGKGTTRLAHDALAAELERLGANAGISAGPDATTAFVRAPASNIEAATHLLSEMVRSPALPQEELERERRRAQDNLRVTLRQPGKVGDLALRRVLFGDAPYGAGAATSASLAALTRDDLTRHQADWWRPDNAQLVIVGSLSPEQGFALAERVFADWRTPAATLPRMPSNRAGTAGRPRVVVVDMPEADQASVSIALRAPTRADSDYYPVLLANSVLGGGATGRLHQEVRLRRALSYSANSFIETLRDGGLLVAQAQTRNDAVPEVTGVMVGEIRRLAAEPIPADQLAKRQTRVMGGFGRQVETTSGLGSFLSSLAAQGLPMTSYDRHLARIAAVTPQQVSASVASELDPAQASIVIAGRASEFIDALRAQYPNVEVIPLSRFDFGRATLSGPPAN